MSVWSRVDEYGNALSPDVRASLRRLESRVKRRRQVRFVGVGLQVLAVAALGAGAAGQWRQLELTRQEQVSLAFVDPISKLVAGIHVHRGTLTGEREDGGTVTRQKAVEQVDASVQRLAALSRAHPELALDATLETLQARWAVVRRLPPAPAAGSVTLPPENYLSVVTRELAGSIGGNSALQFDPEADTHHASQLLVTQVPTVTELVANSRALVARGGDGGPSAAQRLMLQFTVTQLDASLPALRGAIDEVRRHRRVVLPEFDAAATSLVFTAERHARALQELLEDPGRAARRVDFERTSANASQAARNFVPVLARQLSAALDLRERRQIGLLALYVVGVIAVLASGALFARADD